MSHYRNIFEASPDGVLIVDSGGVILEVNRKTTDLFGWTEAELVGSAVEKLIPEAIRERHRAHRDAYVQRPHPRDMGIGVLLQAVRKDGSTFPVEIALSPLPDSSTESVRVVATIRDVTERIRLRDFGAAALRATEDERKRVAQELHDDTSQHLAAILIRLRLAERNAGDDTRALLEEVRHDLMETSEGIRRIARGLRPPELEEAGLEAAVRGRVREFRRSSGIPVLVEIEDAGDLDPVSQLVLYRVVQEALHNTARHSRATHAHVHIGRTGDHVFVEVGDDGVGFDLADHDHGTLGMGLMGMRERVASVSGRITIESAPLEGTTVKARLPCRTPRIARV